MFKAFENDTASHAIHDLTLENGQDRINIYGNLQVTKDRACLAAAKALQAFFNDVVTTLEAETNLAEKIAQGGEDNEVENPFL